VCVCVCVCVWTGVEVAGVVGRHGALCVGGEGGRRGGTGRARLSAIKIIPFLAAAERKELSRGYVARPSEPSSSSGGPTSPPPPPL
jgi:hypothetical protein